MLARSRQSFQAVRAFSLYLSISLVTPWEVTCLLRHYRQIIYIRHTQTNKATCTQGMLIGQCVYVYSTISRAGRETYHSGRQHVMCEHSIKAHQFIQQRTQFLSFAQIDCATNSILRYLPPTICLHSTTTISTFSRPTSSKSSIYHDNLCLINLLNFPYLSCLVSLTEIGERSLASTS